MSKAKSNYPEIDEIREDLDSLKTNVVGLTKHVQENGYKQANELSASAKKRLAKLQAQSQDQMKKVESQVKAKPAQSLAVAFAGGFLASLLFRGRR